MESVAHPRISAIAAHAAENPHTARAAAEQLLAALDSPHSHYAQASAHEREQLREQAQALLRTLPPPRKGKGRGTGRARARAHAREERSTGKALSGPLGEFWRYRIGDYRIIARIEDDALLIFVVRIGHRKEVYRG